MFLLIGGRNREKGYTYTDHHEKFDIDEDAMQRGAGAMAQFAVDFLSGC